MKNKNCYSVEVNKRNGHCKHFFNEPQKAIKSGSWLCYMKKGAAKHYNANKPRRPRRRLNCRQRGMLRGLRWRVDRANRALKHI